MGAIRARGDVLLKKTIEEKYELLLEKCEELENQLETYKLLHGSAEHMIQMYVDEVLDLQEKLKTCTCKGKNIE